jgi:hypothetical protein
MTLEELRRKARFGHRAYLYWTDAAGRFQHAAYNRDAIKRAILDVGVRGKFFWFDSAGCSNVARSFAYMVHLWRCA